MPALLTPSPPHLWHTHARPKRMDAASLHTASAAQQPNRPKHTSELGQGGRESEIPRAHAHTDFGANRTYTRDSHRTSSHKCISPACTLRDCSESFPPSSSRTFLAQTRACPCQLAWQRGGRRRRGTQSNCLAQTDARRAVSSSRARRVRGAGCP